MCKLCDERGHNWPGDPPRCAFDGRVFDPGNWNCATMNVLRTLAAQFNPQYSDEQRCATIPYDGMFIVLGWYKHRGTTEIALVIEGHDQCPLTYRLAKQVIEHYEDAAEAGR